MMNIKEQYKEYMENKTDYFPYLPMIKPVFYFHNDENNYGIMHIDNDVPENKGCWQRGLLRQFAKLLSHLRRGSGGSNPSHPSKI